MLLRLTVLIACRWSVDSSDDAGLFLCEFIYLNSLVHALECKQSGKTLKGIFLHVPPGLEPEDIEKGKATLVRIIKEMVQEA
jgi:pyrrolidone-carboxylate peptidase